ncbi:MAG: rhodanese-like domain-containing protein [Gammaproteobacteria bacterium]
MRTIVRLMWVILIAAAISACAGHDGHHGDHGDYTGKVNSVDAETVAGWYAEGRSFRILDVRTEKEFGEDGHAPEAELVTWSYRGQVEGVNEAFIETVPGRFDADETILILCSLGMRATEAAYALQEQAGFTGVYVFAGGYDGHHMEGFPAGEGWRAADLPLE